MPSLKGMQGWFDFTINKSVVIKDFRLGLLLRLLQAGICIYILYDVISKASYYVKEVPKGVINLSVNASSGLRAQLLREQKEGFKDGDYSSYCANSGMYDYTRDDVTYENIDCVLMDALSIAEQGESKFFVTTFFSVDKLFFVRQQSRQNCPEAGNVDSVPDNSTSLGKFFGSCLYSIEEQYFPIDPESLRFQLMHSYFTSTVGESGSLPETVVRGKNYHGGRELIVPKGEPIDVTLMDLLEVAGVDLDKPLNEQPNPGQLSEAAKGDGNSAYPLARLSGVSLIMSFEYFHRALAPDVYYEPLVPTSNDVICIVEVEPQYVWTFIGPDVRYEISNADHPFFIDPGDRDSSTTPEGDLESMQVYFQRHGVQLSFQVSGNLGKFAFGRLVYYLVASAVLLSEAQQIVTYVALHALGLTSKLYREFVNESINWRKEYARLGVQCLVAGATFRKLDKDNSGTLDQSEVYAYLTEHLKGSLDECEIALLTKFLMQCSRNHSHTFSGGVEERSQVKQETIDMADWVDIFTEEKVQLTFLKRMLKEQDIDVTLMDFLLHLPKKGDDVEDPVSQPSVSEITAPLHPETRHEEEQHLVKSHKSKQT